MKIYVKLTDTQNEQMRRLGQFLKSSPEMLFGENELHNVFSNAGIGIILSQSILLQQKLAFYLRNLDSSHISKESNWNEE